MVDNNYNLSFILSTRNRLPFLRITLEKLLLEVLPDEEIVVVDGNSTDGTKEYLQGLYETGKIQQFVSEPDKNQAHGWNKAMLLAKGTLIKKIIDDDVFCYPAIRECKNYMLVNKNIDACISNCLGVDLTNSEKIETHTRLTNYLAWKDGKVKSFTFSDVYLMIRKNSLSLIGLYDTQFRMLDWEYSLRISYLQSQIAYYTGFMAMGVSTPGNVTSGSTNEVLLREGNIGSMKYEYAGDGSDISTWSRIKIYLGKKLKTNKSVIQHSQKLDQSQIPGLYEKFYFIINDKNSKDNVFK